MVTDRPIYCSGMSDACTTESMTIKNALQELISKGQLELVISGNSEYYERTFPKYEYKHVEPDDPSLMTNLEHPVYINVNGPKVVSQ